jgi:hypothetical protein
MVAAGSHVTLSSANKILLSVGKDLEPEEQPKRIPLNGDGA